MKSKEQILEECLDTRNQSPVLLEKIYTAMDLYAKEFGLGIRPELSKGMNDSKPSPFKTMDNTKEDLFSKDEFKEVLEDNGKAADLQNYERYDVWPDKIYGCGPEKAYDAVMHKAETRAGFISRSQKTTYSLMDNKRILNQYLNSLFSVEKVGGLSITTSRNDCRELEIVVREFGEDSRLVVKGMGYTESFTNDNIFECYEVYDESKRVGSIFLNVDKL